LRALLCAYSGDGHSARVARLADRCLGGKTFAVGEFLNDVSVNVERHRWRVSGLPRDFEHGGTLRDQERYERVPKIVGPERL
jgi:hypothetical protein